MKPIKPKLKIKLQQQQQQQQHQDQQQQKQLQHHQPQPKFTPSMAPRTSPSLTLPPSPRHSPLLQKIIQEDIIVTETFWPTQQQQQQQQQHQQHQNQYQISPRRHIPTNNNPLTSPRSPSSLPPHSPLCFESNSKPRRVLEIKQQQFNSPTEDTWPTNPLQHHHHQHQQHQQHYQQQRSQSHPQPQLKKQNSSRGWWEVCESAPMSFSRSPPRRGGKKGRGGERGKEA